MDPEAQTRFFLSLRLMLSAEHVRRLGEVSEAELWRELAVILLGREYRSAWESPQARKQWRRKARGASRRKQPWFDRDPLRLHPREMSAEKRYRLARTMVRRWSKLQRAVGGDGCLSCLSDALGTWDSAMMTQLLVAQICSRGDDGGIGYRYEVFVDQLLRPLTASSTVQLASPSRRSVGNILRQAVAGRVWLPDGADASERALTAERTGWRGDRFIEPSAPRLEGGDVLVNVDAEPEGDEPAPCWKIRLFSDVRFAPDLRLRVDLREFRGVRADIPVGHALLPMGDSTNVVETPFLTSRYSYDIPLPAAGRLYPDRSYSLLLRVLNADGLTVSEEEQVKLRWPAGGAPRGGPDCSSPAVTED
jgi:hypothetical protein